MAWNGALQIFVFTALVLALARPLGGYMARVFEGERTFLTPVLAPLERLFYRLAGIRPAREQDWIGYGAAMLAFNAAGFILLYAILRLQNHLPLDPQNFSGMSPKLAFNTAISFVTNTNWQAYGGETALGHFAQMTGLTVQNFLSAATGIALAIAFIRALSRERAKTIGNFWVDVTRGTLYVLLPVSIVLALAFVWQGVPQTFAASASATTLEGAKQTLALGPVASQEAIKMLGTNGGGFFNANSAHPFENPTPLANLLEMLAIFAVGAGLTNTFGRMAGSEKQGWSILGAMTALFLGGALICWAAEAYGTPHLAAHGIDRAASALQAGGNMEGKEVRFGIVASSLFATVTTDASCGAVNAMHDSLTALGGFVPMFNMHLGEVVFGGAGSGFYVALLFVLIALFLAGLMVGRTPEYLGKKIESREVKLAVIGIALPSLCMLVGTAVASVVPAGIAGLANRGPHGFSEILYAFTSASANNGSAFAGLSVDTWFYDIVLGLCMFIGRFLPMAPMLAIAGSMALKTRAAASAGTFPTDGVLFAALLAATMLIVGGLTFLPMLALGPIAEQAAMIAGASF
jgi:K+-transporting ATPase ATPase A chain